MPGARLADALLAAIAFLSRLVRRARPWESITPLRLRSLLREGAVLVLDVRETEAYAGEAGHIACARNIPLGELPSRLEELAGWRDGGLVLVCRTQVRSREAARLLAGGGFRGLRIAHGGMQAWREAGFQVAFGPGAARSCHQHAAAEAEGWMPESCRACAIHARNVLPAQAASSGVLAPHATATSSGE